MMSFCLGAQLFVILVIIINCTKVLTKSDSFDNSLPFIFTSDSLPDDLNFMPTVGNGHLGFTILGNTVHLNGIYNGNSGVSRRARIPNYSNITLIPHSGNYSVSYKLNVRTGIFQINIENSQMKIIQLIYAHRFYNRAIINDIYVYRLQAEGSIKINIRQEPGQRTEDIDFSEPAKIIAEEGEANDRNPSFNHDNQTLYIIQGYTKELEDETYQNSKRHVCCLWNHVPEEITLSEDQQFTNLRFVMTADDLCSVAKQEMTDVIRRSSKQLLKSHRAQWLQFWDSFSIHVSDNLKLSKVLYGSIFYLACSLPSLYTNLPSNPFYGLSPTGLGRGNTFDDYLGHNFWDTEIWMLPVVTQMNPQWTKQLLKYRYRVLVTAQDHAKNSGYKGARFPWESAFTGIEVTQPCCPLVALQQIHITADIAFAIQHYFAATNDLEWLQSEGCTLSHSIAEFWASRVQFDEETGLYDIKYVMGPDEDHPNVTNNVFTNVVAGYALKFGDFCSKIKNETFKNDPNWSEIANKLKVPYNEILDFHPQYEGYEINTRIKQADVILLGYPLSYLMNSTTRRNDLRIYEQVTRNSGPAMTWAMHAINHLDIGDHLKAAENFEKGFGDYVREPFQVWSEVITGKKGAVNFLTGAGGFLQSVINGYAGIRIHLDYMEIRNPSVPPNSTSLVVSGIKYMGSDFKITISDNVTHLRCTKINGHQPLKLVDSKDEHEISTNFIYIITDYSIQIKLNESYIIQ